MKRKLLSLTLVLALVLSLVPMGAFAAAGDDFVITTAGAATAVAGNTVASTISNIVLTETANADLAAGNIVLTAAAGLQFSGALPTVTLTNATAGTAAFNAGMTTLTIPVTAPNDGALSVLTISGLKTVVPSNLTAAGPLTVDTTGVAGTVVAATVTVAAPVSNQFNTVVSIDKSSVTADGTSYAEMTIYALDPNSVPVANQKLTVYSSRANSDKIAAGTGYSIVLAEDDGTTPEPGEESLSTVLTDNNGKAVVRISSSSAGTAKIGVFLTAPNAFPVARYQQVLTGITDGTINATTLKLVGSAKDLTFTSDSAGKFAYDTIINSSGAGVFGAAYDTATTPKSVIFGDFQADGVTAIAAANQIKANGTDYYKVVFRLQTESGVPVAGQTVKFDSSDSAVTFDTTSATTDGAGAVTVKVYSTKNGTVSVNAKAGSINSEKNYLLKLKYAANGVNSVELATTDNAVIAKDEEKSVKFRLYDANGNQLKLSENVNTGSTLMNDYKASISVEKEPSGSDLESGVLSKFVTDSKDRLVTVIKPKYEGEYVFRVKLDNGKRADFRFTVKKQGEVKDLDFYYDETVVPAGKSATSLTLDRLDAAKVAVDGTNSLSEFYFTSSDNSIATVDSKGKVTFIAGTNDENVGKQVTVTATDKVNKLAKSYTFTVGGKISNLLATPPKSAAVGADAALNVQFADKNGKPVAFAFETGDTLTTDYVVVSKPEGATIGSNVNEGAFKSDIQTTGGTWKITSNKAGEVKVQLIVKHKVALTGVETAYTTVATINFGAAQSTAAKTLVLNMGSTTGFMNNGAVKSDLAPFIKDGRAFVPVSFIAAQLGGTAEFTKNAAGLVDTVTVKAGTTTVTMTIGSTTIKVVKDGKESTVTSDVAPFIKSGRTVLPFRAIAEAMGAKVSFGPETGAVEWVKFEM